jgi:hypothetical protein
VIEMIDLLALHARDRAVAVRVDVVVVVRVGLRVRVCSYFWTMPPPSSVMRAVACVASTPNKKAQEEAEQDDFGFDHGGCP